VISNVDEITDFANRPDDIVIQTCDRNAISIIGLSIPSKAFPHMEYKIPFLFHALIITKNK
jgi:hypothetical protein